MGQCPSISGRHTVGLVVHLFLHKVSGNTVNTLEKIPHDHMFPDFSLRCLDGLQHPHDPAYSRTSGLENGWVDVTWMLSFVWLGTNIALRFLAK